MIRYILSRFLVAILLIWGLVTLTFGLVALLPGDPAVALLGEYATPQDIARINAQLGLDKPFLLRYFDYLVGVAQGDLGNSFFTGRAVADELWTRLPNTLIYLVPGLLGALGLGLVMGTIAAYRAGRFSDRVFTVAVSILMAIPEFILALLLIYIFYQNLKIAPAPLGMLSAAQSMPPAVTGWLPVDIVLAQKWDTLAALLARTVLPALTLTLFFSAYFGKTVRSGLLQILNSPQIEFARACGLKPFQVFRYALIDVRGAILTYLVILLASALSGAAIVESVFSWPGIGGWSLDGVLKGDVPVIQGFVLAMGSASLLGYVVIDSLITLLDPRARQVATRKKPASKAKDRAIRAVTVPATK